MDRAKYRVILDENLTETANDWSRGSSSTRAKTRQLNIWGSVVLNWSVMILRCLYLWFHWIWVLIISYSFKSHSFYLFLCLSLLLIHFIIYLGHILLYFNLLSSFFVLFNSSLLFSSIPAAIHLHLFTHSLPPASD